MYWSKLEIFLHFSQDSQFSVSEKHEALSIQKGERAKHSILTLDVAHFCEHGMKQWGLQEMEKAFSGWTGFTFSAPELINFYSVFFSNALSY
jgi:hypothetical protein